MSYEIEVMLRNSTDQTFKVKDYTVTENWLCLKENEKVKFWINREHVLSFVVIEQEEKKNIAYPADEDMKR